MKWLPMVQRTIRFVQREMKTLPVMLLTDRDAFWDRLRTQSIQQGGWWTGEKMFFLQHFGATFEARKEALKCVHGRRERLRGR